uniref:ABC transmembrane type-1 domain-containing protein n=1 Tax=Acrobeloides nanus TaxID=290746 RepID=A0A914CYF4_9BILA
MHDHPEIEETSKKKEKEKPAPSVLWPLFQTFKWPFLGHAVYKLIFDLLLFISPQLLSALISFMQDKTKPLWMGVAIAAMMFVIVLVQSMILHQYYHAMFRLGMYIRSVLTSMVYKKALVLSNKSRKNRTVGEIINLMSVDIQRLQDSTFFVNSFWSSPLQTEQMKYKDERIKLMSDVLNGIKILKLYAWEASIQKQILNIRKKELKVLKKLAYLQSVMTLMWTCAPFLVAVSTFSVYVTIDPENNVLTPQITFVALSLFNILRFPLAVFGTVFGMTIQLQVSNKRMKTFLAEEEIEEMPSDETALEGEMHRNDGYVSLRGRVAYVPQQAWIQNLSLKSNILFNQEFNEKLYKKVLEACSLAQDLESLPAGDATEIGEKGINLSGGQKQRVSLARALYSDSDIYLLDDSLAAVDAHVGKSIFENVIFYMAYIRAIGFKIAVTFLLVDIMGSSMGICGNLWLANWSDHAKEIQMRNETDSSETRFRLGVYAALGLGQVLFVTSAAIIMALGMVYASSILHENMLSNILRSPMSFFDVTPIGRILNRFSKDVDGVDTAIPRSLISFVQTAIASIEILLVIAWATPASLFAIGPLIFIYLAVLVGF